MPVRKQEAHRALELLEEYHSKLSKPQDKQLRNAIERVIRIFKSRLFQALLDIQEFYEITLLDDTKSIQQKTAETLQIACKWENSPPITGTHSNSTEKYRYPEEVDLPPTSSRLKDVDGLGTSVDHYSSSAVESPRKVSACLFASLLVVDLRSGCTSRRSSELLLRPSDHSPNTVDQALG
ncbi:disks large homolog 1-like isoform X2 [Rhipicephalus microplus]|uniref:disks large homolog 1-like isoform X2 n=1 Tax=Rhipicephalus microplus TaxID=6941 RepID=UPI003F6B41A8